MGPVMRLILLGPPGCGKGTQAKLLSRRMGLEHIGTGDLLRAAIQAETPVGLQAKSFVEAGQLVPDEVVNALVAERFRREDRPEKFVLDGYPRRVEQAMFLDPVLEEVGLPLTAVLLIQVPDAEITNRVTGRWSCPKPGCKATYNTQKNPPRKAGICDDCGTVLVQRADDKVETVEARLVVYHRDTVSLIPHYRAQGLLREVPGEGEIEAVYRNLLQAMQTPAGKRC
jgi:adenylate kinase